MGHHFWVALGLIWAWPGIILAQSGGIVGPDGRGAVPTAPPLAPRPAQPSLEEQLRRKRKLEKEQPPPPPARGRDMPNQPAMGTDELLGPQEKEQIAALQEEMNLKVAEPRFRMNLGLAIPKAQRSSGSIDTWRFDPGVVWAGAFRLTDPSRAFTFWTGLRLAAWNGNGQSPDTFGRFSVVYFGPLAALEWQGTLRQTLALGFAGSSRQADPIFPGNDQTKTRRFGFDGAGAWLEYGMGFRIVPGFEWDARLGVQSNASYLLTYLSLGVSLWTE